MMGIHKEIRKIFGASVQNYIISARTAQGYEQWGSSTREERLDIISRWHEMKSDIQNMSQKTHDQDGTDGHDCEHLPAPRGFLQTRHLTFDERKKLSEDRKQKSTQEQGRTYGDHNGLRCPLCAKISPHQHDDGQSLPVSNQQAVPQILEPSNADMAEFEDAIQASVKATSRGNLDQDMLIERAIRASVRELQTHRPTSLNEHEALDRAIQASIAEAGKSGTNEPSDVDRAAALETAIQKSLFELGGSYSSSGRASDGREEEEEDEDLKRAIEESRSHHEQQLSRAKTDEEVVMEYVKKQSLAEEEHKKAMNAKQVVEDDDEELRQAIEESKKSLGPVG